MLYQVLDDKRDLRSKALDLGAKCNRSRGNQSSFTKSLRYQKIQHYLYKILKTVDTCCIHFPSAQNCGPKCTRAKVVSLPVSRNSRGHSGNLVRWRIAEREQR